MEIVKNKTQNKLKFHILSMMMIFFSLDQQSVIELEFVFRCWMMMMMMIDNK